MKKVHTLKRLIVVFSFIFLGAGLASAGPFLAANDTEGGDGGVYIDVSIENVDVDPAVVTRGEKVTIRVQLRNRSDVDPDTAVLFVESEGKTLFSRLIEMDGWDVHDRKEIVISWDTTSASPGEYPLKIVLSVPFDLDEFDNEFRVETPVVVR